MSIFLVLSIILNFCIFLYGDCLSIPCVKDVYDTDCPNEMFPFCAGEVGFKTCCSIGNHTLGAVCDTDARCESPFICSKSKRLCIVGVDGPCENDDDCETLMNCEADSKEENGTKTCVMPLGRVCEGDQDCPAVLTCESVHEEQDNKTCVAGLGGTCKVTAHCSTGLVCLESTKKCVPPIIIGEACTVSGDCASGLSCEGELGNRTCVAGIHGACSIHTHCSRDLYCSISMCVPASSVGEKCKVDEECVSGHTCEGDADLGTCVAGLGGACSTDEHCSRDLVCQNVCVSRASMIFIPTLLIIVVLAMFQ